MLDFVLFVFEEYQLDIDRVEFEVLSNKSTLLLQTYFEVASLI